MGKLTVTRGKGQQVCIGDSIIVTVREIHEHRVVLVIDAPEEVSIDRRELRERKEREKLIGRTD